MSLPFDQDKRVAGLSPVQRLTKRAFDLILALFLVVSLSGIILILAIVARIDTGKSGIFRQTRVGLFGESFTVYKLRTMYELSDVSSNVTARGDKRVTRIGGFFRRWKLDEVPQLFNILNGTMSFVGPRPDVPESYEGLSEDQLHILSVRPGITGPASIHFRNEEVLLAKVDDPEKHSREVIFPKKVQLNLVYIKQYSIWLDIKLIFQTIFMRGIRA
ncbi:MAG: sugar transferase [Rhizobiaceae bacterium]